jgi:MoaA/NifB/PqqE/SkfB family radical SAM enzyme
MKWGNLLLLMARAAESNFRRLDFPYKLNFIVTDRCDCRCRACRIWEKDAGNELTLEEIRTFFRNSNAFSWVDLSGGEIFLREDIVPVIAAVLENCRRLALLHFPTNGLLVERTVESTREILRLGPPRLVVTVSIDGPRKINDQLRGVEGAFDRALETYTALRELRGCEVFLGMTLMPENMDMFGETLAAVRKAAPWVTADDLHVNLMHRSSHYYGNLALPPLDRARTGRAVDIIRRKRSRGIGPLPFLERRYLAGAAEFLESGRASVPCRALQATCFLSSDGTVYPCTSYDRPLGSLRESGYDLKRIWDSHSAHAALEAIGRGECPGCWTPCEAFPAIAGSVFRSGEAGVHAGVRAPAAAGRRNAE